MEEKVLFEFTTKLRGAYVHYTTSVKVYDEKVEINRVGKTGGLPKSSTIYFENVTSIIKGGTGGVVLKRDWITFTVPGSVQLNNDIVQVTKPGKVYVESIPFKDPFSIVFGMDIKDDEFDNLYSQVLKYYNIYKNNNKKNNVSQVIQQTDSLDKIKKLKELYDLDIISKEEYEEKKKKLMEEV